MLESDVANLPPSCSFTSNEMGSIPVHSWSPVFVCYNLLNTSIIGEIPSKDDITQMEGRDVRLMSAVADTI